MRQYDRMLLFEYMHIGLSIREYGGENVSMTCTPRLNEHVVHHTIVYLELFKFNLHEMSKLDRKHSTGLL